MKAQLLENTSVASANEALGNLTSQLSGMSNMMKAQASANKFRTMVKSARGAVLDAIQMAKLYKDVGDMDSFRQFMEKAKELQTEQLALTKKGADNSDNKDEKEMVSSR